NSQRSRLQIPPSLLSAKDECWPIKLKQCCRDILRWPRLDKDIEQLVRDCTPCLLSGKTSPPPLPPLGSLPWPTQPWDHIHLDICRELHDVPHHLRFLVVVYDLHSKWPEVAPVGSVTSSSIIAFLESLGPAKHSDDRQWPSNDVC
ncbi:hypothetical protein QTP70_034791, partial [Hemibagrus guttatus]